MSLQQEPATGPSPAPATTPGICECGSRTAAHPGGGAGGLRRFRDRSGFRSTCPWVSTLSTPRGSAPASAGAFWWPREIGAASAPRARNQPPEMLVRWQRRKSRRILASPTNDCPMKLKPFILVHDAPHTGGVGAATGVSVHERRMSGLPQLGYVSCIHCHQRAGHACHGEAPSHHDAPGGIAVSSDGKTLFIALDDRDEWRRPIWLRLRCPAGRRCGRARSGWRWTRWASGCSWPARNHDRSRCSTRSISKSKQH